jgi:hypothetical protein
MQLSLYRCMRKTLLTIGSAVIVSMLLAPHGTKPGGLRGWGPFFSDYGFSAQDFAYGVIGRVMIDMLILQTVFLAVLFALIVNIRWRPSRRVLIWFAVCATLVLMVCFGFPAFQQQMKTGAENEEWRARRDINNGKLDLAKEHLLKSANYWWWKGWWDGARNAKQHAFDEQGMERQAAAFHAEKNEERARQLLRMTKVLDQFDSARARQSNPFADLIPQGKGYPDDKKIAEAKRLLLEAAEKWHIAGSTAEEQRVRAWEKNVKTEAEVLAFVPDQPPNWALDEIILPAPKSSDQPPNKSVSTDPNAGLKDPESRRQWEAEKAQCREPLHYPPVKWDHQTEFGKTFAIIKFRERNAGDRKKDLDGYTKAIGARFYKQWSRVKQFGADWVEVVFYK